MYFQIWLAMLNAGKLNGVLSSLEDNSSDSYILCESSRSARTSLLETSVNHEKQGHTREYIVPLETCFEAPFLLQSDTQEHGSDQ